jgi:tetratricopeptide (TPR) repeat protein
VLVALAGGGTRPAVALGPQDRACVTVPAKTDRLPRAERERRLEQARHEAREALARRLWDEAFATQTDLAMRSAEGSFATLRRRYGVAELLEGGSYEVSGKRSSKTVTHCVSGTTFRRAQAALRRQRGETVDFFRLQFAEIEARLAAADGEDLSAGLTRLEIELVNEALGLAVYRSTRDGREMPFYRWLDEWRSEARPGERFVQAMIEHAEELLQHGQLEEADRYVARALESDPASAPARKLREEIQERRVLRVDRLRRAQALALDGRFEQAAATLEEARALGGDDLLVLEETETFIAGQRAAYEEWNPRRAISLFVSTGALGVDTSSIERRVSEDRDLQGGPQVPIDGSQPLGFGAAGSFRLGRRFCAAASGSWGVSQDRNSFPGVAPLELYEMFQLTGGVGYRTLRSATRRVAFGVLAGPAWEAVDVNTELPSQLDDDDAQFGMFVRLDAEWRHATIFVQRGFGFDDVENSLVGWSEGVQFAIGVTF